VGAYLVKITSELVLCGFSTEKITRQELIYAPDLLLAGFPYPNLSFKAEIVLLPFKKDSSPIFQANAAEGNIPHLSSGLQPMCHHDGVLL
jgi:hypothetical protein